LKFLSRSSGKKRIGKPFASLLSGSRLAAGLVLLLFLAGTAAGETNPANRLVRMDLRQFARHTRLTLVFSQPPRYTYSTCPGRGMRLTLMDTFGPPLKKFRSYSDRHVAGVSLSNRGDRLVVDCAFRGGDVGVRRVENTDQNLLVFDLGAVGQPNGTAAMPAGRERIWSGAGKLVREFSPPLKSELPFLPTPGTLIRKLLPAGEVQAFLRGEEALYRERGAEAEEVFTTFLGHDRQVRAVAAYRLGEAQYLLQKYESALGWFREGERLWPEYMVESPSIVFSYGDSLARCGEPEGARRMFDRLILGMAESKYGPMLVLRKADILAREGREMDALAMYRNVASAFRGTKAALLASIRLADRSLFRVNGNDYRHLAHEYERIFSLSGDGALKEEALFKRALVEALYGPVAEAADAVAEYERKFPGGVFSNVAKTMREDLVFSLYHEMYAAGDCRGLARLALDNRRYLARCAGEREFIPRVSSCLLSQGMVREELELFSSLVETPWAPVNTRFLYVRIIEDAWTLGELPMAEAASKRFLAIFPRDPMTGHVRERLAALQYRNGDMAAVRNTLAPLLERKAPSASPESYYYLGKACERLGDKVRAEKSMLTYLAAVGGNADTALAADARMVLAAGMAARGNVKGAVAVYRLGFDVSTDERKEMFLYKVGEGELLLGKPDEARSCWDRLLKEGKDPVWKSMAAQALADLSVRRMLDATSK